MMGARDGVNMAAGGRKIDLSFDGPLTDEQRRKLDRAQDVLGYRFENE